MRTLQNSKSLITFDNAQCRCFQAPLPNKQYFLSKNQIPNNLIPYNTNPSIPENIQQALIKTNIKRSLKRMCSPQPSQSILSDQELEIDEIPSFRAMKIPEPDNSKLLKTQKTTPNQFQTSKIQPNTINVSFKKPHYDFNRPVIQYNSNVQHPSFYIPNPQYNRLTQPPNPNQFKKLETSKININFASNIPKQKETFPMPAHIIKTQSLKNLILKTQSMKQLGQIPRPTVNQKMKIPKLERKHSKIESSDLGITQTITKHSIINSALAFEPLKAQFEDKSQIRETAAFKGTNEASIKNQSVKISQTTKLKQNTYKSVINTKRSLLTETNRSKIVSKKQRPRPVLSKMQDVQEIRSLADSDEQKNSDKQSVVLGRLNEYQSATYINRADLEESLQFIQNSNSIIMDAPSAEWRHEVESEYGY